MYVCFLRVLICMTLNLTSEKYSLDQWFSTGVRQNLRVPLVVSNGFAGPPVLSKNKLCPTFVANRRVF